MIVRMSEDEIAAALLTLRTQGWLSRTPEEFRSALLTECNWHRIDAGTPLIHAGDENGGISAVASGTINVISALGSSDSAVIHVARAPFWFGLNPVVAQRERAFTIIARTGCEIATIPQHALIAVMAINPEWWRQMAVLALDQLDLATQTATDLAMRNSRRRCLAVLLRLGNCYETGDAPCEIPVGQDELAAMANLSRQTASAMLRELATDGTLELGYRSITINRPWALRAIVDD